MNRKHIGSSFESFLRSEGMLDEIDKIVRERIAEIDAHIAAAEERLRKLTPHYEVTRVPDAASPSEGKPVVRRR